MDMSPPKNNRGRVFIILAVYQPNRRFLLKQLFSIKHQTHQDFICHCISDGKGQIEEDILSFFSQDPRFVFDQFEERRGVFNVFTHGLTMVPEDADWVAFCDQDDVWHPNKLLIATQKLSDESLDLVYSDARMIDKDDHFIAPSYYQYQRKSMQKPLSDNLLKNSISGMSLVFSSRLARKCVPGFTQGEPLMFYHDCWVALVAYANGLRYAAIDKPLLDYRIHENNLSGRKMRRSILMIVVKYGLHILVRPFKMKRCLAIYRLRSRVFYTLLKHEAATEPLDYFRPYFKRKGWFGFYLKQFCHQIKAGEPRRALVVWSMFWAKILLAKPMRKWVLGVYRQSNQDIKKMAIGI